MDPELESTKINVAEGDNLIKFDEMTTSKETERCLKADKKFRICKTFKVSSYNVRTLFQTGKFHQLYSGCHKEVS